MRCVAGYDAPGTPCWVTPFSAGYYGFAAYCVGPKGNTTCTECGIINSLCCPGVKIGESASCGSRAGNGVCMKVGKEKKCVGCGALGEPCCGSGVFLTQCRL